MSELAIIESLKELECLRTDWLALLKRSSTATPFQSPDWLIPWWRHFGTGRLCVLAFIEEMRLAGLAALFVTSSKDLHRSLRLIGTGNTDYLDIVVDDRVRQESVAAIFSYLCKTRREWDEVDFQNLPRASPLLARNTCSEFVEHVEEQDACPVLSLPASEEQFLATLPRRLRHNLNYYSHKLSTLGEMKIERAGEHDFTELFDAFVSLHEMRWRLNNMPGVLCDDGVQSFLREAALGLLSHGVLRLYGLRIDGRIIASLYGFRHALRAYYYLGGFDPEFRRYSPGTILVAHAIAEAIGEGAREFDFLRGREDYKYRWGAIDQIIYRKRLD
jgi:CelD/BcsL family acetyltransferase involved in cellulose biosynthesis